MDLLTDFISPIIEHDVTKWTLAFSIAAWLHSGRVKKEIKTQFVGIVDSINNLGVALRNDMNSQSDRIINVEQGVNKLTDRVSLLENKDVVK